MTTPQRCICACVAVLLLVFTVNSAALAQSVFTQQNDFDFRATHLATISGTTFAAAIHVDTDTDWGIFKLRYEPTRIWQEGQHVIQPLYDGSSWWSVDGVFVDWTGTGETFVPLPDGSDISHTFAPPPNGISAIYAIVVQIRLSRPGWPPGHRDVTYLSRSVPLTVFANAPVFTTPDGDALVQMHNDDAHEKGPILIVEGIDPTNSTSMDTYYTLTKSLVDSLYSRNYEVFFLNFHDATRDLAANAEVVRGALRTVHQVCPNSAIALAGMSMGGVIARYALAESEQDGEDHHVALYISYDAPQKKAHANAALQDYIYYQNASEPAIAALQAVLKSPAAKQMLGYNTYDRSQHDHNLFYNTLNALNTDGYPHTCRNVAISNGTRQGAYAADRNGGYLLTLEVLLLNSAILIQDVNAEELDVRPGSIQVSFEQEQYGVLFSHRSMFFGLVQIPSVYYRLEALFNPVYMPTASTLDLREPILYDDDGNLYSDGGSHFDESYTQLVPTERPYAFPHNAVTAGSMAKVLEWLTTTKRDIQVQYTAIDGGSIAPETLSVSAIGPSVYVQQKIVQSGGRAVVYEFYQWDDGSTENPRALYPSGTVVHTAVMKAHLASGSSGVASLGTQRRIAEVPDQGVATFHAAYESGGSVWYLRNRRNAGWENERCLSSLAVGATNVMVSASASSVIVAWMEPDGNIHERSSADSGQTWSAPTTVATGGPASAPTLDSGAGLVWSKGGTNPGIYLAHDPTSELIPLTDGGTVPAVCIAYSGPVHASKCGFSYYPVNAVAFVQNGVVKVGEYFQPPGFEILPCDAAFTVSAGGATNPTIVATGADLMVAWEESGLNGHRIGFRQRHYDGALGTVIWAATVYFTAYADGATKPVLSIDAACGYINLFWQYSGGIVRTTRPLAGTSWNGYTVDMGRAPSVSPGDTYKLATMSTSGTSAPYPITINASLPCWTPIIQGGCPYVDTRTADGWKIENSILARATDGSLQTDVYRLKGTPTLDVGRYALRMRENEQENTTLDQVRLGVVDHAADVQAFAMGNRIVLGQPQPAQRVTRSNGEDVTGLVLSGEFVAQAGETLLVDLTTPQKTGVSVMDDEDPNYIIIEPGCKEPVLCDGEGMAAGGSQYLSQQAGGAQADAFVLDRTGIVLQGRTADGAWKTVRKVYPRARFDQLLIDTLGTGTVRLVCVGPHQIHFIGRIVPIGLAAPVPLQLLAARHSRLGDVRSAVARQDDISTQMGPGDTLNLAFAATPIDSGKVRDVFFVSRGVYTSMSAPLAQHVDRVAVAIQYALLQNQPNPFSASTAIAFDLPKSSHVKLEVFDLQGRIVQTLADRDYEPGHWGLTWNRLRGDGTMAPHGVYLYRLEAGEFRSQRKMVLLP